MPALDPSPLGDEMVRRLPERKFPDPKFAEASVPADGVRPADGDAASKPDIEDEEADPVLDSGPGLADGVDSLKKQRG